jgi:hypothetical protein
MLAPFALSSALQSLDPAGLPSLLATGLTHAAHGNFARGEGAGRTCATNCTSCVKQASAVQVMRLALLYSLLDMREAATIKLETISWERCVCVPPR